MKKTSLLSVLLLTAAMGACASGQGTVKVAGAAGHRPAWIPSPNREHPDFLYVTAVCRDATTLSSGKACALEDARRQVESEIGKAGVELKGDHVADEHSELRRTQGGVYDVWLLVAYPRGEVKKAQAKASDAVLLGVFCTADGKNCPENLRGRIEQAMTKGGLKPLPAKADAAAADPENPAESIRTARSLGAAWTLLIRFEAKFLSQHEEEFYAQARGWYRLIDVQEGRVQASFDTDWMEGGHYSRKDAVDRALDNAAEAVSTRLAVGGCR
jgi:hypothetical protein